MTKDIENALASAEGGATAGDPFTLNTKTLYNKKVWFSRPRKNDPDAVKKLGRVRAWVFHPKDLRCVGFLVKRPDVVLMFHRQDTFVAYNGFDVIDGDIVVKDAPGATDRSACKALGINLDNCVLWIDLPVMTPDGSPLGLVGSVNFDTRTGRIISLEVDSGATANTLLGHRVIPVEAIVGFRRGAGAQLYLTDNDDPEARGAIMVKDSAREVEASGGIAEKAGTATAVATDKAKRTVRKVKPKVEKVTKKATAAAGEAVNKGAYLTGRQISRASGMFGAFKDNFTAAMNADDDDTSADDASRE